MRTTGFNPCFHLEQDRGKLNPQNGLVVEGFNGCSTYLFRQQIYRKGRMTFRRRICKVSREPYWFLFY